MPCRDPKRISVRKRSDGTLAYQVTIRAKGVKTQRGTFDTEEDAQKFIAKVLPTMRRQSEKLQEQIERERKIDPTMVGLLEMPIRRVLARYAERPQSSDSTVAHLSTVMANVGEAKVRDMKRSWCRAYIDKMAKKHTRFGRPYSPDTIHKHLSMMGRAVKWQAHEWDLEPPGTGYDGSMIDDKNVKRDRRLSPDEELRLRRKFNSMDEAARAQYNGLLTLALETAARLQELVLAKWSEFDFAKKVWTLPERHTKKETQRGIPLTDNAIAALATMARIAPETDARIFTRFRTPNSASGCFRNQIQQCGIKGLRPHDLRHEAISRMVLLQRGWNMIEIMKIVGHMDHATLLRYANLRADELVGRMVSTPPFHAPSSLQPRSMFAALRIEAAISPGPESAAAAGAEEHA